MAFKTVCFLLCIACVAATASQPGRPRTLLGVDRSNFDSNDRAQNNVRAQAATSQAILEAVDAGGAGDATRNAGDVGGAITFAAAQSNQDVFDAVERQTGARRRSLLRDGFNTPNSRAANTLRSQAATSQAITEAVAAGGDRFATRRAGFVGSSLTFAAAQNNDEVFDATERQIGARKLLTQQIATAARILGHHIALAPAASNQHQIVTRRSLKGTNVYFRPSDRASNTLRAQAATAQAITEAVDSGADNFAVRRSARVGSDLTFAAAQNDQNVFDTVEHLSG